VLEVHRLTRQFNDVPVLDEVSFDLHSGHAAALAGPNGSGKTTLLRCVVGADVPDEGDVLLDGNPLVESDPAVRAAMACALDDADFFAELSVVEHLELLARAHGVAEPGEIVEDVLSELDLPDQRDQLPVTLSSGQRRRPTLGACLVRPTACCQRCSCPRSNWSCARSLSDRSPVGSSTSAGPLR
jgi:ABC-2 type transport system ATP-binding protein